MAISVVSSTQNAGAAATSLSLSLPSGGTTGDLLIVIVSNNNTTCTDNNGAAALAKDKEHVAMAGGNTLTLFSRKTDGTESGTLNFTLAVSQRWAAVAFLVRDWDGTTVYDVASNSFTNQAAVSSTITCSGVTTGIDGALAIAVANIDGSANGTFSATASPAGWTDIQIVNTQQPVAVAYKVITTASATGNVAMACTLSAGNGAGLNIFSIKPLEGATVNSGFFNFF